MFVDRIFIEEKFGGALTKLNQQEFEVLNLML